MWVSPLHTHITNLSLYFRNGDDYCYKAVCCELSIQLFSWTLGSVLHHLRAAEETPVLTAAGSETSLGLCRADKRSVSTAAPGVSAPEYSRSFRFIPMIRSGISHLLTLIQILCWLLFLLQSVFYLLLLFLGWLFSLSTTFDTPQAAKCSVVAADWKFGRFYFLELTSKTDFTLFWMTNTPIVAQEKHGKLIYYKPMSYRESIQTCIDSVWGGLILNWMTFRNPVFLCWRCMKSAREM